MEGKIVNFDKATGKGTIVSLSGESIEFEAKQWGSFEEMPEIGLLVEIDQSTERIRAKTKSQSEDITSKLIAKRDDYLNRSSVNGWTIETINDQGFVIKNHEFSYSGFILYLFLAWLLFAVLMGFFVPKMFLIFSIIPAAICAFIAAKSAGNYTLYGKIDYENRTIIITKKGKVFQELKV